MYIFYLLVQQVQIIELLGNINLFSNITFHTLESNADLNNLHHTFY